MEILKITTTAALFSLMIARWWWWWMTKKFSKIRELHPETNQEVDHKSSLLRTLQCSRRTRVVQVRSLDSTSLNKPQDHHTGTRSRMPELPLLSELNWYARCRLLSRAWVSTATTSLAQASQKPLSILGRRRVPSRTCTRDSESTKDLTERPLFRKPSSKVANLIRWEEAQVSCSKKQLQPLDKILDSEKWKHSEILRFYYISKKNTYFNIW